MIGKIEKKDTKCYERSYWKNCNFTSSSSFPISPQSIRVSNYNKPVQMVIYGSTYEELEEIQKK